MSVHHGGAVLTFLCYQAQKGSVALLELVQVNPPFSLRATCGTRQARRSAPGGINIIPPGALLLAAAAFDEEAFMAAMCVALAHAVYLQAVQ